MFERMVNTTSRGWRPWAIGAAVSMGAAALFFAWRGLATLRARSDYEAWWRQRDRVRANGHKSTPAGERTGNPQLFI
jgi:hypothetical protein